MSKYKHWDLIETLPSGWKIDKSAGSPLFGYVFATNGKSILNGGERALLLVTDVKKTAEKPAQIPVAFERTKPKQVIDKNYRHTVNALARKKFIERLLRDIRADLMVCELEDWSKKEYIFTLTELIKSLNSDEPAKTFLLKANFIGCKPEVNHEPLL